MMQFEKLWDENGNECLIVMVSYTKDFYIDSLDLEKLKKELKKEKLK